MNEKNEMSFTENRSQIGGYLKDDLTKREIYENLKGIEKSDSIPDEKIEELLSEQVEALFSENELLPSPDQKLTELVTENLKYFRKDELEDFLVADKRFNKGPVCVHYKNGKEEKVFWHHLRESLKKLPEYMQIAKSAGLQYETANELLQHTMSSVEYDHEQEYRTILLLTRALNQLTNKEDLDPDIDMLKEMITVGGNANMQEECLDIFSTAKKIGLSTEQACEIIMELPQKDGKSSAYTFPYFSRALESFSVAKVDPNLLFEAFKLLGGKSPYSSQGNYQIFEILVTFGCPTNKITPNEMLEYFIKHAKITGSADVNIPLLKTFSDELNSVGQKSSDEVMSKKKETEDYFNKIDENLKFAALPYQTEKSLNRGVRDLGKLAIADVYREIEESGEGMWVFNPDTNIWYSLGGKLEVTPGRVRHNFVPYDISKLAKNPMLFHVHQEYLDIMIAPREKNLKSPFLKEKLTKFLLATPSRADYLTTAELTKRSDGVSHSKSHIVHPFGITEFCMPDDPVKIEEMVQKIGDIRDKVIAELDSNKNVANIKNCLNTPEFIQELIEEQNKLLPEDFKIIFHPINFKMEANK